MALTSQAEGDKENSCARTNESLGAIGLWWEWCALALIALLAAALRRPGLSESLWLDELHSTWATDGALSDVLGRAGLGNQGPIYFWGLWVWRLLFGSSEWSVRFFSMLPGMALPFAVRWSFNQLFVNRGEFDARSAARVLGLVAALLAATDPLAVFYSTEARPYAWLILGSVIHFTSFVGWLRELRFVPGLTLVLFGLLLFYLHYTFALLAVAEVVAAGLCAAVTPHFITRWKWHQFVTYACVIGVSLWPAVSVLNELFQRKQNWEQFVGIASPLDLVRIFPAAWGLILLIVVLTICFWRKRQSGRADESSVAVEWLPNRWLVAAWLVVPLILAWLATFLGIARLFFPRYLLTALPASWLILTEALRSFPAGKLRCIAIASVLIAWLGGNSALITLWSSQAAGHYRKNEDWRSAVAYLNEQLPTHPGPIVFRSGLIEMRSSTNVHPLTVEIPTGQPPFKLQQEYLQFPLRSIYRLQPNQIELTHCLDASLASFLEQNTKGCWLLIRGTLACDAAETVWLPSDWQRLEDRSFGKLQVLFISPPSSPAPRSNAQEGAIPGE